MYDLLSIDEMARLFNLIKCSLQVIVPRVQPLVRELLSLIDSDNTGQAINLRPNPAIYDHITKLVFGSLYRDAHKLAHSFKRDATIVPLNDAQVVLDELPDQLDHVVLAVQSPVLERFKGRHLLCDIILLKWHQFKCQELSNVFRKQLVLLEFARVHSLNQIELVDLFGCVR